MGENLRKKAGISQGIYMQAAGEKKQKPGQYCQNKRSTTF